MNRSTLPLSRLSKMIYCDPSLIYLRALRVSVVNLYHSGRIPITAIIRPVLPNSARCEKKRLVSQAVQPSITLMCSLRDSRLLQVAAGWPQPGRDEFPVPGSPCPGARWFMNKQRITHVNRVGIENLFEKLAGVGELRFEFGAHFRVQPNSSSAECMARWRRADREAHCRTAGASRPRLSQQSAPRFRAIPHETQPTTRRLVSASNTGTQSAVLIASSSPGTSVMSPSPVSDSR